MTKRTESRRDFLSKMGALTVAGSLGNLPSSLGSRSAGGDTNEGIAAQVLAAIGDTLIPSDPQDPGYRDLEKYGITEAAMATLPLDVGQLAEFNRAAQTFLGNDFLNLAEGRRERFLYTVIEGTSFGDANLLATCREVYELSRTHIFRLFYQNFPEHAVPRDANDIPILKVGDIHQITNPNTSEIVTGWDIANYGGPMAWQEEEDRRRRFQKIHWHEDDGNDCSLL